MNNLFSRLLGKRGEKHPYCSAIVAAAGSSERMGGENKLTMLLEGVPVLVRTLWALDEAELIDEIVVAVREEDLLPISDLCKQYGVRKPVKLVRGGATRLASVYAASLECAAGAKLLAVHDGDRPLADAALIDRVAAMAARTNAAAPAVPVKDTVKVAKDGVVERTPERDSLRAVQTPQIFDASLLRSALQAAVDAGETVTDDCAAVERLGKQVYLTEGSYANLKITTPEDMALAAALLRWREERQQ